MVHGISNEIKVSVCAELNLPLSKTKDGIYHFDYTIYIENFRDHAVQLLSRKWYVRSQYGVETCIQGNGVVGNQPILEPQESFCYSSFTYVQCAFAHMHGHYVFQNMINKEQFLVQIPAFELTLPWCLN